jgi:hypothetical protein
VIVDDESFCRGCHRKLDGPLPTEGVVRVPCVCGFINLFEHNVTDLPIGPEIELAADAATARTLLADTDDSRRCRHVLEQAFGLLVTAAQRTVADALLVAVAARWPTLVEFDRRSRTFRAGARDEVWRMTVAARAVQILEASLLDAGVDPALAPRTSHAEVQWFVDRFFRFASSAATVAPLVDLFEKGHGTGRIRRGRFEMYKTRSHTRYQEWIINRGRVERNDIRTVSDDEHFSTAAAEAVEAWLGFSPAVGRTLFANRHQRLAEGATHTEATVYAIPRSRCPGDMAMLFDRLTLTRERARRFELPFYWDLGIDASSDARPDLPLRLAARNWLFYYPLLETTIDGEPGFFASAEALTHSVAGVEGMKNGMLQRIAHVLAADPAADSARRTRVNQLRVAANRRFEELAASLGRERGFSVAHGLDRIGGRLPEGGEIDLLWARRDAGRVVLLVGEVKDFDMVLHRDGSEASLRRRLESAEAQLERKAATVRRTWRDLFGLLTGEAATDGDAVLAKAVVTSAYLPPHLANRYPLLTLGELEPFARTAWTWPQDAAPRFPDAIERLS